MFEDGPPDALLVALVITTYVVSAMFLGAVRGEEPDKLNSYDDPSIASLAIGPLYVPFVAVMSLDYESWDLSRTTKWIGRTLFVLFSGTIATILWQLVSLA